MMQHLSWSLKDDRELAKYSGQEEQYTRKREREREPWRRSPVRGLVAILKQLKVQSGLDSVRVVTDKAREVSQAIQAF